MSKFFVSPGNIRGDRILVQGEDVNHIVRVLRMKVGDQLTLCDGEGRDYTVCIDEIGKEEVNTKILDCRDSLTEPPVNVILFQGIPKAAKMEYIIQKTTELGISRVVPVVTRRTVVKLEEGRNEKNKINRWQKIAREAAKQSNRGRIPHISYPVSFDDAIKEGSSLDMCIMAYEGEQNKSIKSCLVPGMHYRSIGIFIGPEGGFDAEEVSKAQEEGINIVSLGPRILRTETAGLAVLSIIMYETGGM
ncbi:MAG: 16S rRNA (uracil(1498)-N(3))-methyltransferase [Clostridiaceae bacterium]|nr:16S rRNA (uracil(1498)-N(3))-methyltransferase [Clostridiaceae bacterium]